jgi:hypothetical protein
MSVAVQVMSEVNIVGDRALLDHSGFESRRKSGVGYYLGREEVLRRGAVYLPQLFITLPGMTVRWNGYNNVPMMRSIRGDYCLPRVVVDGKRSASLDELSYLHPREIRGIEVYPRANGLPPHLQGIGGSAALVDVSLMTSDCGTILIWTGTMLKAP